MCFFFQSPTCVFECAHWMNALRRQDFCILLWKNGKFVPFFAPDVLIRNQRKKRGTFFLYFIYIYNNIRNSCTHATWHAHYNSLVNTTRLVSRVIYIIHFLIRTSSSTEFKNLPALHTYVSCCCCFFSSYPAFMRF